MQRAALGPEDPRPGSASLGFTDYMYSILKPTCWVGGVNPAEKEFFIDNLLVRIH